MSDYKVKLGATLSFNKEQEKDIVMQLEKLKSRHKLGEFISHCIRVVLENKEFAEEHGFNIERFGLTDNRKKFFDAVREETDRMNKKIDAIYDMAYKTYSLALFNKKIGMEDKSRNLLQAQFVLQKQMREMSRILGVENISQVYESNRVNDVERNVDETLEFIINYYDGVVNELQENIARQAMMVQPVMQIADTSSTESSSEPSTVSKVSKTESAKTDEDNEYVDFGTENKAEEEETKNNADTDEEETEQVEFDASNMDALLNFIN